MPTEVIMPKVDMDMTHGVITRWHVTEGDRVSLNDPLFEIETDKAAMEVECPADGTVRHIIADTGETIPIGVVVAWVYASGEPVPETRPDNAPPEAEPPETRLPETRPRDDTASSVSDASGDSSSASVQTRVLEAAINRPRASPKAKAHAREQAVDLATLMGTGPRGRIQFSDVDRAVRTRAPGSAHTPEPRARASSLQTGPLSVLTSGSGNATPLVLLHGLASDGLSWARLEPGLQSGRRLFKIELPGHGKSPRLAITSFTDLVRQVRRAFDDLGLERCHLVGHSLGGGLALSLADTRAGGVASLTLISPAGLGPDIDRAPLDGISRASSADSLAPWLRALVHDPDLITRNLVQSILSQRSDPALRQYQATLTDVLFPDATQAFDLRPALDRVSVPTRLIWGRQDSIFPWRHALRAPGRVSLNLFERTGHLPHVEQQDDIGRLIATDMERVAGTCSRDNSSND